MCVGLVDQRGTEKLPGPLSVAAVSYLSVGRASRDWVTLSVSAGTK